MLCRGCGADEELRVGYCFDCAQKGEERAAKRHVHQHLWTGFKKLIQINYEGHRFGMKCDFTWAWQRLTHTGDYADGGTFDRESYNWRAS